MKKKTEAEELAQDSGMLRPFMISALPPGWIREVDQKYNIVYYDTVNNETTHEHPRTLEFRKMFHKIYKLQQEPRAHDIHKLTFKDDPRAEVWRIIN